MSALLRYTEAPIRQGQLEKPWGGVVSAMVLGDAVRAVDGMEYAAAQGVQQYWKRAEADEAMQRFAKELSRRVLESQ